MKVYLAGHVPKGDKEKKRFKNWREDYKKKLVGIKELEFIDPKDNTKLFESKPFLLFGADCTMIKNSDLVIVYSERKLGVGTSQEMLVAKHFNKPVVTVLPKDTHHRRSNVVFEGKLIKDWIHPFIFSTSDLIIENIEDAIPWIREYIKNPKSKKIKGSKIIEEGIKEFERFNSG